MTATRNEGSAGDADYGAIGRHYSSYRRPDPRIAAAILAALGDALTVLNVGAGAGSYEPTDRDVTAVEPSETMRAQRPPHLTRAIDAVAEALPFADGAFDAAMATFTVHQWKDLDAGLAELRRVARGPVVILTCDPDEVRRFWLHDYIPGVLDAEARRYPPIDRLTAALGAGSEVRAVPVPADCIDGFNEAYYRRPEMFLDPQARLSCSAWSFVSAAAVADFESDLAHDLADGTWNQRYGHLRALDAFEGSLRLVIGRP